MKCYMVKMLAACVIALLCGHSGHAQSLRENDTLYIGNATGSAGEQVMIPIFVRTTADYQGWQIPVNFGYGQSPIYCDSISTAGTVMEDWSFQAPFTNNYEWDGVQTCGIAGLVNFMGGSIPPGYYQVMKMYFSIDPGANAMTIPLDTTTSRWYDGGPLNEFIVTVGGMSYITHVVPGYIAVEAQGTDEHPTVVRNIDFNLYPTVVRQGQVITFTCAGGQADCLYTVFDACGRLISRIPVTEKRTQYSSEDLRPGVYYVIREQGGESATRKIVVQ